MSKKSSPATIGASLVVASSLFYASYGIWTKLMGDFFQGYTASALRSVLVLIILIPIALTFRRLEPLHIKQNGKYIVGMFVSSLFTWGPLYYAIQHAGVGISLAINYASIVIGSLFFGWLFAHERLTKDKAISAILGFIGLGLIFSPSTANLGWLALAGALVSGLSAGANAVFCKQIHYSATQATVVLWAASVAANLLMAIILREHYPVIGAHIEWLYLVIFAIASVIASWLLVKGVKLIDAGTAGILGLLEIVFGVLFGVLFFHERPDALALVGMAVIIIATAIPYLHVRGETSDKL